ncbi:MAG: type II toxin-antitoxin system RelE/ParE family toxin [Waddliaceae bacterium]
MKYQIKITDKILKKLTKFPRKDKERIIEAIDSLVENPRPEGCKKLKGNQPLLYRIRTGNYRVVYSIQDQALIILVVEVDHRKDAYR